MTYEEFYKKVFTAERNAKGYEHLGYNVTLVLKQFYQEEAAQQSVQADGAVCSVCQSKVPASEILCLQCQD